MKPNALLNEKNRSKIFGLGGTVLFHLGIIGIFLLTHLEAANPPENTEIWIEFEEGDGELMQEDPEEYDSPIKLKTELSGDREDPAESFSETEDPVENRQVEEVETEDPDRTEGQIAEGEVPVKLDDRARFRKRKKKNPDGGGNAAYEEKQDGREDGNAKNAPIDGEPSATLEGEPIASGEGCHLVRPDQNKVPSGTTERIVVHLTINMDGTVLKANAGQGSTTFDKTLVKLAEEAAMKSTFPRISDTSKTTVRRGTITYTFSNQA